MANEPDNLVLVQLREIRAMQAAMQADNSAQFARINERLDRMDKRFEDFRAVTGHALTLSTATDLRMREFDQRHAFSEGEQRRMTGRMEEFEQSMTKRIEEFERRLAQVEHKLDD